MENQTTVRKIKITSAEDARAAGLWVMAAYWDVFQALQKVEEPQDCPNCPNLGYYTIRKYNFSKEDGGDEIDFEQCQWCYETPNSKFNYARRLTEEEKAV